MVCRLKWVFVCTTILSANMFAYMSAVPMGLITASPRASLSFSQMYLISTCLALDYPPSTTAIQLKLSWYTITGPFLYPCPAKNLIRYSSWFALSDRATSSACVLD